MQRVLWVLLALLVSYEIYATVSKPTGDTLSEIIWDLCKYPVVPFMFGFLCGHLFWQSKP